MKAITCNHDNEDYYPRCTECGAWVVRLSRFEHLSLYVITVALIIMATLVILVEVQS